MIVRPATMDDAHALFDWRNDALTRAMSKNMDSIQWDDHVAWLNRRLSQPDPGLYIAEIEGQSVGTIRIDGNEVSYTTAPSMRGKGIAKAMLEWAFENFGSLTAEIKLDNQPSISAATRAGHRVVIL